MKYLFFLLMVLCLPFSILSKTNVCSSKLALHIQNDQKVLVNADDKNIAYIGRFDFSNVQKPVFMYSGCAIRTVFTGTSIDMVLKDDSLKNRFTVIIDDSLFVVKADKNDKRYSLAKSLKNKKHTIEIIRRTEWHGGNSVFMGFYIDKKAKLYRPKVRKRKIEFIGNSYTCGYGNEGENHDEHFKYETENSYLTYSAITSRALHAEYIAVCRSGIGMYKGYDGDTIFNMPLLYDTIAAGSKAKWNYGKNQVQLVCVYLGGNDANTGLDSSIFVNKYLTFLNRIRTNYPNAKILCLADSTSGSEKEIQLNSYIKTVASEYGKKFPPIYFFRFKPILTDGSDWHPNVVGHRRMADELTPEIRRIMNW